MRRKLVTILVGDFVASTTAMEFDEEASVSKVGACLDVVADAINRHGGRVFSTAGDSLLAEFESPVNALRSAIEARYSIGSVAGVGANDMRFGLHIADVVIVGDDLRGDGVNLAARIQSSAVPGAIEVSSALYDQVRRVSPCKFDFVGERKLKGISEAIQIYRVAAVMDRHVYQVAPTRMDHAVSGPFRPNSVAVTRLSIAPGADQDQLFLAEGFTDDLTLELSRLKGLFVSSRTASTSLATADPVEIGKALGVRYVVGGSIRKSGADVRLNISLTATSEGHVIWSDRITRPFAELLDIMDEITARVAATISGRVEQTELAAARLKRPESMTAYEYYLRGLDHHRLAGVSDQHVHAAMEWFDKSIKADPGFGRPHAMRVCSWSNLESFDIEVAETQVAHALIMDPSDPEAHRIMGAIRMMSNDFAASRYHMNKAFELAPNDAYVIGRGAAFYVFAGEPLRALELLDRAETLDPFLPVWIIEDRVAALYALDRFDDVVNVARALPFQTRRSLIYQIAAQVARGCLEEARTLVGQALVLDPRLSVQYVRSQETYEDRDILEKLVSRVRAGGLPNLPEMQVKRGSVKAM